MIQNILSRSPHISVLCGYSPPNFYGNHGLGVGNLRYNTNSQKFEVFDGNTWITMNPGSIEIKTSETLDRVVEWAEKKMREEAEIEMLAEQHPAMRAALDNLNKAKDQVRATKILIKE